MTALAVTWGITALATGGVILRPWKMPEAIWAVSGAVLLVACGLLPMTAAVQGVARGTDVYLFLVGMMMLAEVARREGLFDWLAGHAASAARGSSARLFTLIYMVGTLVTIFLSNDATAVVLTPAVAAVTRTVKARNPLPYLLVCAFIANAASFVLPISNPANLVIYGRHMPALSDWLARFALPSALSVAATYTVLRLTQSRALRQEIAAPAATETLSPGGHVAAAGIFLTASALMTASAQDWQLGLPTCLAGVLTAFAVLLMKREAPWAMLRAISWGVLPLVAGLFVLVEALGRTGVIGAIGLLLREAERQSAPGAAWASGVALAFACNLLNNLPAGLIAGTAVQAGHGTPEVTGAVLIGVDVGPNLAVTGSLATILWLGVLRREGLTVRGATFLRIGCLVMPPALLLSLGALIVGSKLH
jgi:arsenical pump membrane protein